MDGIFSDVPSQRRIIILTMKKMFQRLLAALLCLMAVWLPCAVAEDSFTIDVDLLDMGSLNSNDYVARALSSSTQGVRVIKSVSPGSEVAAPVRLTLVQVNTQTVLFDKDYGFVSGVFDSGVIYLPYAGDSTTPYLVTLYVDNYVYAMPFMHLQRRLSGNGACTTGARLRELNPSYGGDWYMGTVVDMHGGSFVVDVCAANSYVIGQAQISISGGSVRVDLMFDPSANVEVSNEHLYVVTSPDAFHQAPAYRPGEWVDAGGASTVLVYLPMEVSFDPAGLRAFQYDAAGAQRQAGLWNAGRSTASPMGDAAIAVPDNGWSNPGWTDDGWENDYGWDDGWESDADGWM